MKQLILALSMLPVFVHADTVTVPVISVVPRVTAVMVPVTRTVCEQETVAAEPNTAGTILGAIAGAAIGNQIGKGSGRDVATVVGGVLGGAVGGNSGGNSNTRQVCKDVTTYYREAGPTVYYVTYKFNNVIYNAELPYDPGQVITLNVQHSIQ